MPRLAKNVPREIADLTCNHLNARGIISDFSLLAQIHTAIKDAGELVIAPKPRAKKGETS